MNVNLLAVKMHSVVLCHNQSQIQKSRHSSVLPNFMTLVSSVNSLGSVVPWRLMEYIYLRRLLCPWFLAEPVVVKEGVRVYYEKKIFL